MRTVRFSSRPLEVPMARRTSASLAAAVLVALSVSGCMTRSEDTGYSEFATVTPVPVKDAPLTVKPADRENNKAREGGAAGNEG
jgi:hypothetical protein